jgi:tRNA(Arg) A34 adenosine deaminase TadA
MIFLTAADVVTMAALVDLAPRTIEQGRQHVEAGGRPFACVIARDGEIIAESPNLVAQDP